MLFITKQHKSKYMLSLEKSQEKLFSNIPYFGDYFLIFGKKKKRETFRQDDDFQQSLVQVSSKTKMLKTAVSV